MTLKKYFQILGKRIWIFIITIVILLLATYIFSVVAPDKYSGSLSVYTLITQEQIPQNQGEFYQYDNYYIFRSSELFADTVITWLKDPVSVAKIYAQADETLPEVGLKKYSRLIQTKKNEPAAVQVTIQSENRDFVDKLIISTRNFIDTKVDDWEKKGLLENTNVDISEPIIIKEKVSILFNLAIALVVSVVLGLALVYFTEYMQSKD